MRPVRSLFALAALSLPLLACQASVGTAGLISVPPDSAKQCADHCDSIGLELSSVVIMANSVGCVCGAGGMPHEAPRAAAASAGGMAALMTEAQERDRQSRAQVSRH